MPHRLQGRGGEHLKDPEHQGQEEGHFEEGKFQSYTHRSLTTDLAEEKTKDLKDETPAHSSICYNCILSRIGPRQEIRYNSQSVPEVRG